MPDRSYIIEILLRARDETARAFASAMGELEAYDKAVEESNKKLLASRAAHTAYNKAVDEGTTSIKQKDAALKEHGLTSQDQLRKEIELEKAQRAVTQSILAGNEGTKQHTLLLGDLVRAEERYAESLKTNKKFTDDIIASRIAETRHIADQTTAIEHETRVNEERARSLGRVSEAAARAAQIEAAERKKASDAIIRADEEATRRVEQNRRNLSRYLEQEQNRLETIDAKAARAEEARIAKQEQILRRAASLAQITEAPGRRRTVSARATVARAQRGLGAAEQELIHVGGLAPEEAAQQIQGVRQQAQDDLGLNKFDQLKNKFKDLDGSVKGFDSSIRNAFGFALVTFIQPAMALMVGLAGAFAAVGSAAISAGAAIGTTFLSAMVQGIPVMGLLTASMQRLTQVFSYVQAAAQSVQQRFMAQYQTAIQNRLGINQVAIAAHGLSDALYSQQQAIRQVSIAQFGLTQTRQQAARQLQDLTFQEQSARLAAEASSLSVVNAQKALRQAIATGGDVQQAQLDLQQAQLGHTQAVTQAQRAIADASQGSIARQAIAQQVSQAQVAVTQAQRAVVDAQFSVAQARAGLVQAQQAATGFNASVAAQLAYMRSQMSRTELALANILMPLFNPQSPLRRALHTLTDQIVAAFIPLASRLIQIFQRRDFFGALLNLATQIGNAFRTVFATLTSSQAVRAFIALINDAARNVGPLAGIVSAMLRGFGAIAQAAAPFVHDLLVTVESLAKAFAAWATSVKGQNWLKQFFTDAFGSLKAFMDVGLALVQLIAAVVTQGGGAQAGIRLLDDFAKRIDQVTNSINNHGRAWQILQQLWQSAAPALHAVGEIFGAIGNAFLQIGGTPEGRRSMQAFADVIAHVLVPAFVQFALIIGFVVSQITQFLQHHPALMSALSGILGIVLTLSFAVKGIKLIFGPFAAAITILKTVGGLLGGVARRLGEIGVLAIGRLFGLEGLPEYERLLDRIKGAGGPAATMETAMKRGGDYAASRMEEALHGVRGGGRPNGGSISHVVEIAGQPIRVFVVNWEEIAAGRGLGGGPHEVPPGEHVPVEPRTPGPIRRAVSRVTAPIRRTVTRITSPVRRAAGAVLGPITRGVQPIRRAAATAAAIASLSPVGRALRGLGSFARAIPLLDLGFLGFGALGPSAEGPGLFGHLATGIESIDPTGLLGLLPGPTHGFQGIAHSLFHPLFHAVGGDLTAPRPEQTAYNLQQRQGIPQSFSFSRALRGESSQQIITEWDRTLKPVFAHATTSFRQLGKDVSTNILDVIKDIPNKFRQPFKDATNRATAEFDSFHKNVTTKISNTQANILGAIRNIARTVGTGTNRGLQTFTSNIGTTVTTAIDNINAAVSGVHDGIKSINTQMSNSLKAMGVTSVTNITTGTVQKVSAAIKSFLNVATAFAGGGFVGNMGERGRDGVLALLGRGEAVLNWGHQKLVEPALNAFYGFGLADLFQRTAGSHAGQQSQGGYATGGYIYPFPRGTLIGRSDQGVDANMPVGSPIGPMGPAVVKGVIQNWYKGQPFIWWELTDGPRKGQYGYVAEQITNLAPVGAVLQPNQAVAAYAPSGTGIEYGWATASGSTLARATTGYTEGQVTPAGADMHSFLLGLAHGQILGGLFGAAANISPPLVKGAGHLAALAQKVLQRITDQANNYLNQKQQTSGGTGNVSSLSGFAAKGTSAAANQSLGHRMMRAFGYPESEWPALLALWNQESSWEAGPSSVNPSSGAYGIPQANPSGGQGHPYALNDPVAQIKWGLQYIKNRYGTPSAAEAHELSYHWYNQGGYAGGKPVSVTAHVGEWILNKSQQMKLASRLGMTVDSLKKSLGFSGGPTSFQGGGEIGDYRTGRFNRAGTYTGPDIAVDTEAFYAAALSIYTRAQSRVINNITAKVRASSRKFNSALDRFIANYNVVGGDSGLFALAATAVSDFVSRQQTAVTLAAAGIREIGQRLRRGTAQTALQAATTDLRSTQQIIAQLEPLQRSEVEALAQVNRQIAALGPHPERHHLKQYQTLLSAREDFIKKIQDADSQLASAYTDLYTKQTAQFQAEVDARMRNPTLRLNLAQLNQQIAQAFGRTGQLLGPRGADQQVINALQAQQQILQNEYFRAASRARHDPRWQKTADDLLQQLQGVIASVAQAQAQQLQDAISAADTRAQIQQSAIDMTNRLIQVQAGLGDQVGAAARQIDVSRLHQQQLGEQFQTYNNLLGQARAQGNVSAINDLTQKIEDLTAQMAEANLQTQQLITAYRQLSISILQIQTQATSGFFSAANQIAQTLGAIAGNQNLPALIAYAKEAGASLIDQGKSIVANIMAAVNDPNAPFGANQAQAGGLLTQLVNAYQGGPQQFANVLAALGPALGQFEAGLPQDQATLFQNLVQALIDNTTSIVNNTQQLQQLNATTLQQQFTSSAWSMFREAIFNGLGGLLPNYALAVPSMDVGGYISRSGLLYGHQGETIVPAGVQRGPVGGGNYGDVNVHVTNPTEVADPVHLGNAIAWRLAHDPNSR